MRAAVLVGDFQSTFLDVVVGLLVKWHRFVTVEAGRVVHVLLILVELSLRAPFFAKVE